MRFHLLAVSMLGLAVSCESHRTASASGGAPVPAAKGLVFLNEAIKEFSFTATFHRANAEAGTWHLIVEEGREMASLACFTTDVSPGKIYQSLKAIGATDGNNVNDGNFQAADIATAGDSIDFTFDWKGQSERVPLRRLFREVVPDLPTSGGERGLDMRFGGNYTAEDAARPPCHATGSLVCLYTCSAAVISNATANKALLKREKDLYRYRLDPALGLEDGTRVRVYVRRK